ncbi:MAG: amino acid adenylation domain-containing protein, partial [Polyangiales bacterium]
YAQLERATRNLATQLLATPATDDVVALYSRRSGELVVGMLACLRAGLTFAVLDAAYPVERLELLLGVLQPGRFVTIGSDLAPLSPSAPVVPLAMDALLAADGHDDRLDRGRPDAIAYLLFTSGTTGVPKCIATAHPPLVHFIDWYEQTFAVTERSRFSMLSGLGHDPVLRDILVPLSTGAELHVPPHSTVLDPVKLYAWLAEAGITHAHVTPQLSRIVCAGRRDQPALESLAFVGSGGDTLRTRQAKELIAVAPRARVVNFYGSTETPQAMGFHIFDPRADRDDAVPIGRGIADVQLLVLDDDLRVEDHGAPGQIAIRTRYLSAGYRADPGLTQAKFVANPRASDPLDRLYLTGDVGRWRSDGVVSIEGRLDDQVKIRGFRVELGDVVAQLQKLPGVTDAAVLPEQLPDGESRLVAYLVGNGATATVRDAMLLAAPPYMVPARYVWVAAFPLLPNGKLDRAALAKLEPVDTAPAPAVALDPIEATIIANWKTLLSQPRIDVDSSFIELGGNSLSFIEASVQLEDLLGKLPDRWERLSIRELARAKQPRRGRSTSVDSSVLLRAISIVGVVIGHYELPNLAGTVIALFVVSGMSFGKFLAPQIARTDRITPIVRLVAKIAIPTIIYSIIVNIFFHLPTWPGMLLINNLVSSNSHISGIGFWYLDVLVQCFVILGLLLALPPVRRLLSGDPFAWLIGATLVFAGIAAIAPFVVDTSALADRVPHHYLGALLLGWALIHAETRARKLIVVAVTVVTFAQFAWESEYYLWFPFVATLFVLAVQRVSLPIHAGRLVNIVANASLFIYLTDHQVGWAFEKAHLESHGMLMVITAVVVGIILWKLWDIATSIALRLLRRS